MAGGHVAADEASAHKPEFAPNETGIEPNEREFLDQGQNWELQEVGWIQRDWNLLHPGYKIPFHFQ